MGNGDTGTLRGVVALDGPSGTGKSTVARRLAAAVRAGYLDTGAMYRAVTLAVLRAGVDLADDAALTRVAAGSLVTVGTDPAAPTVLLDGTDVADAVRTAEVTAAVSEVATVPGVRELLVAEQRRVIAETVRDRGGIVVEGRDIGTVVATDAPLKVYLTASEHARADRRHRQDSAAGRPGSADDARRANAHRDRIDSGRATDPLRRAPDAVDLDTTDIDPTGVVARLLAVLTERDLVHTTERNTP